MRFRVSGVNWEGRRWTLVPSLVTLANQIDRLHPERSPADGTVAGKNHDANNPKSDHRPKPYEGAGVVRAIDAGETVENDAFNMAEAIRLSKDKRALYVIHEGRMFSSYTSSGIAPYTWRPYGGPNPHAGHFHISSVAIYDNLAAPWTITEQEDDMPTIEEIRDVIREELDRLVDGRPGAANKMQGVGQAVGLNPIGKSGLNMAQTVQETLTIVKQEEEG